MGYFIAALVAGLLAFGVWAIVADANHCKSIGGHQVSKGVAGVGITGNGQVGPTFSTVTFCVSADGRILY